MMEDRSVIGCSVLFCGLLILLSLFIPTMASSETLQTHEAIASQLAQYRPTIDAAVKSFMSLYAARSLTREDSHSHQDALQQARILLQTINKFTFPLQAEPTEEYKVVAQIWNGLIASNQKPTKFLGRAALKQAWQHGLPGEVKRANTNGQESLFCEEFGSLLLSYDPSTTTTLTEDSDACLVWDCDRGQAELARRRSRRAERAKEAHVLHEDTQESSRIISELSNDNEETNTETTKQ